MQNFLTKLWNDESGQDLVEYALLLVLIAIAGAAVLITLGGEINNVFTRASEDLEAGLTEAP